MLPDYQSHGLVGVKGNVLPPQKNKIEIPTSLGLRKHPTVVEKNVSAQKKWYHIIPFFFIFVVYLVTPFSTSCSTHARPDFAFSCFFFLASSDVPDLRVIPR